MVAVPELEQRHLNAPRFRVKAMKPWSPNSAFTHLAHFGRPKVYEREQLRIYAGEVPLEQWLEGLLFSEDVYVEAWVDGRWRPASWWWLLRQAAGEQSEPSSPDLQRLGAHMKSVRLKIAGKGPQLGEAAFHLERHVGLRRDDAIAVAKGADYAVFDSSWKNALKNGSRRLKGRSCQFCEN